MKNLIAALQLIYSKMGLEVEFPTQCGPDELRVYTDVDTSDFTKAELKQLDQWGFIWDEDEGGFVSSFYGSC
jgi:hypothetical protein